MNAVLGYGLSRALLILSRKKAFMSLFFMLSFIVLSSLSTGLFAQAPYPGTIESRRDWVINDLANRNPNYVVSSTSGILVAKVLKNIDRAWALDELGKLLDKETNDALQIHQAMHSYLVIGEDYYTQEMKNKLESYFDTPDYASPTFCSENFRYSHWATGYMVGEYLPHVEDAQGRSGQDLIDKTRDLLYDYFDDLVNRGFGEFGSVNYAHHTYDVIRMLAEYAKDPDMKDRATMICDWFWANWATDYHNGYLVTASSRDKGITHMHAGPSNLDNHALATWVYLGAHRRVEDFGHESDNMTTRDGYNFWAVYEDHYEPPQIIQDIGNTAKNSAFEYRKRSFYDFCHNELRINRYGFLEEKWGLASMCFNNFGDKGEMGEGNFMTLNWDSPHEASMFWVTKGTKKPHIFDFLSGDRFFMHNVMQHERTMVGTITSENSDDDQLYAAFSKSGAIEKRVEEEGWIFCHTGVNLFAFKTVKSWYWDDDHDRYNVLRSDHAKNGWILETADLSDYSGGGVDAELDAFKNDVLANSSFDDSHIDESSPRLIYTSIHGYTMDNTFYNVKDAINDNFKVNGTPIDYESFDQIETPWISQEINSGVMTLDHNGDTAYYDFNDWTVSDKVPEDTVPPASPANLSATGNDGSVSLTWDGNSESDLAGYNVYRSTTSGDSYSKINDSLVSTSDYTDDDVNNGTTYYYVLTAVDDSDNESGYSSEAEVDVLALEAPSNLVANVVEGDVTLSWDANDENGLACYNVYRSSTSGSGYSQVNSSPVTSAEYVDSDVSVGNTYYYVVTAVDEADNESDYSAEASATLENLPPAAPGNLSAAVDDGSVALTWDDNDEGDLAGYNVYRSSTSGSGYSQINSSPVTSAEYVDNDVSGDNTYYYVVTAVDEGDNESDYSNEAEIVVTFVQDVKSNGNLKVFPNPLTKGELTVNFGEMYEGAKVTVRDLRGVEVYQAEVSGDETNISAEEIPPEGVYIISVSHNGEVAQELFVVQ